MSESEEKWRKPPPDGLKYFDNWADARRYAVAGIDAYLAAEDA